MLKFIQVLKALPLRPAVVVNLAAHIIAETSKHATRLCKPSAER